MKIEDCWVGMIVAFGGTADERRFRVDRVGNCVLDVTEIGHGDRYYVYQLVDIFHLPQMILGEE